MNEKSNQTLGMVGIHLPKRKPGPLNSRVSMQVVMK